jgi:hypothetical protein
MIRFAADENLNRKLVTGLQRRTRRPDIVRVQDAGLRGADDPTVLAWAAEENRILLTHDLATMSRYAYDRVEAGLPMPGVFEIPTTLPLAVGIEELVLIAEVSLDGEWDGQVRYLPLR